MSDKLEAALHGQTAVEEVKMGHVPREVIFGYPVEEGESVGDDYIETCMVCNESMPCAPLRAIEEVERLRALAGRGMNALAVERDEARAALARVKELHRPVTNSTSALHPEPLCAGDSNEEWPCPTIRALEGATDD